MLDKGNRPFLLLKESEFAGPATSASGENWLHSIAVRFQNISHQQATQVRGHAAVFLDGKIVTPSFIFTDFTLDPYGTARWNVLLSVDTYAHGVSASHKLELYVNLKYGGTTNDRKYQAQLWATYHADGECFQEMFTDLQESRRIAAVGNQMEASNEALNLPKCRWTH